MTICLCVHTFCNVVFIVLIIYTIEYNTQGPYQYNTHQEAGRGEMNPSPRQSIDQLAFDGSTLSEVSPTTPLSQRATRNRQTYLN
jgi:hypothetical protein